MSNKENKDPSLFTTWLIIAFIFSLVAGIGKGIANLINGEDGFFSGIVDELSWLFWILIFIVFFIILIVIFGGGKKSKYS